MSSNLVSLSNKVQYKIIMFKKKQISFFHLKSCDYKQVDSDVVLIHRRFFVKLKQKIKHPKIIVIFFFNDKLEPIVAKRL